MVAPEPLTYVAPPIIPIEKPVEIVIAEPIKKAETVPEKIEKRAIELGVNPKLALGIAKAESRFIPDAKNPLSSASGVFQFLNGTFSDYCINRYKLASSLAEKNDPDIQIECALLMLQAGGESHWHESRHIWINYL